MIGGIKMKVRYVNYPNAYVKVKALMTQQLDRPKHRTTVLVNDDEWLPIIKEETPI